MPKRLKVAPTKSALIHLKKQLRFLEQGHALLERKKELLTRLVYEQLKTYKTLRNKAHDGLQQAYYWLGITQVRTEEQSLQTLGYGMKAALEVNILPRSSLGVQYPGVSTKVLPLEPIGLMGTDSSLDETRLHFAQMVAMLAELGEAETALWRLLEEQRKTQKRVNALKYNVMPQYRETIHFIQAGLEEEERNTLFQTKRLAESQDLFDILSTNGR
ncbi:V-type ATP synthase subunit D [Candidatus Venteria ishoeyi]|uniref:V-type ATP synthase subunit D n=1 Tax=Candidatus Venteria ishoeyi TaxID=1899563 RepID=A0A1H6FJG1_9GAMM|nr:V-type ATP synthase subunit D [Candidatus Venteria ishoeyi]MDM8546783.1 V-type ATP synthase subunit D [Candidatus Venteria ishoeyi]SEH09154.1 V-type sodium ATPase subunit D [Candidatus Venteria ishoeyi]SEH09283.1 V-type sodium ATPase subunit D [Candidatus Venteria ishoeyi]